MLVKGVPLLYSSNTFMPSLSTPNMKARLPLLPVVATAPMPGGTSVAVISIDCHSHRPLVSFVPENTNFGFWKSTAPLLSRTGEK